MCISNPTSAVEFVSKDFGCHDELRASLEGTIELCTSDPETPDRSDAGQQVAGLDVKALLIRVHTVTDDVTADGFIAVGFDDTADL